MVNRKKITIRVLILLVIFTFSLSTYSQIDYSKFEGTKSKITIKKEYPFVNVYDYGSEKSSLDSTITRVLSSKTPEALITKKFEKELSENTADTIVFSIKPKTRLIVEMNDVRRYFISYITSKEQTIRVVEFIKQNEAFEEINSTSKENQLFKEMLKYANAFILFKFYNRRNDKDYPIINRLKSKAKNDNGRLEIEKLVAVLKNNENDLRKYF